MPPHLSRHSTKPVKHSVPMTKLMTMPDKIWSPGVWARESQEGFNQLQVPEDGLQYRP